MASNGYCVLHSEGYNHVFNNYNEKHKKDDKRASCWPKKKKGAKNKVSLVLALPLSFRLQLFVSERRERKKTRHETVRRSAKFAQKHTRPPYRRGRPPYVCCWACGDESNFTIFSSIFLSVQLERLPNETPNDNGYYNDAKILRVA